MGWSARDIPSQEGRLAVVTGATGGVGFEAAQALAAAGAQVVIASRDPAKGAAALGRLADVAPAGAVRFERVDLGELASVRAFADRLLGEDRPVDLLVNNAGLMTPRRRATTAEGWEAQMGVNYLGHFALAGLLMPLLRRRAGSARVVDVASLAHRGGRIDFADLQSERWSGMQAYGRSKAAMLMFARAFQRRSQAQGWGVASLAAHPGWASTDLLRPDGGASGAVLGLVRLAEPLLGQSAGRGALPILYAATAPQAEPGGYVGPDGFMEMKGDPAPARVADFIDDAADQDRLWAESERLTGVAYG